MTLLRHRRRRLSPRTVRKFRMFSGGGRPRVIATAINGVTRDHVTKSRRFYHRVGCTRARVRARNVRACRRVIPKKES